MLVAKKILAANLIVGGAIVVAAGTAAIAYAMSDPNCRDKIKDCPVLQSIRDSRPEGQRL